MIQREWPPDAPQGARYKLYCIAGIDVAEYAQSAAEKFRRQFGELPRFGFVHLGRLHLGPLPEKMKEEGGD